MTAILSPSEIRRLPDPTGPRWNHPNNGVRPLCQGDGCTQPLTRASVAITAGVIRKTLWADGCWQVWASSAVEYDYEGRYRLGLTAQTKPVSIACDCEPAMLWYGCPSARGEPCAHRQAP